MELKAYAKLNLYLGITGRRSDGMHEIESVMQEISLFDVVRAEKSEGISVYCPGITCIENTAHKAARIFFERTGIKGGISVSIDKGIPVRSGLGGGSSDAAAVLRMLDSMYGTRLGDDEMRSMGISVGSDVPFFITGGSAVVKGIGETVSEIENNTDTVYLIVLPEKGISTPEAYRLYDRDPQTGTGIERVVSAMKTGDTAGLTEGTYNALTGPAAVLCPEIGSILGALRREGASGSLMSGSGSACVGLFRTRAEAESASAAFAGSSTYIAENVTGVSRGTGA